MFHWQSKPNNWDWVSKNKTKTNIKNKIKLLHRPQREEQKHKNLLPAYLKNEEADVEETEWTKIFREPFYTWSLFNIS